MSCSCDFETPDVFDQVTRHARKAYRCDDCGIRRINPGDAYVETRGLWDHKWSTYRACLRCQRVRDALDRDDCGCIALGCRGVREALQDRTFDRHCARHMFWQTGGSGPPPETVAWRKESYERSLGRKARA